MTLPSMGDALFTYFNQFIAWDLITGFLALAFGLFAGGIVLAIVRRVFFSG